MSDRVRFWVLSAIIVLSLVAGWFFKVDLKKVLETLRAVPLYFSGPLFVVLFVVGTFFLWYLHDPLYVISALVYGAFWGTFFLYIAHLLNALIFFQMSAKMGADFVDKKVSPKYHRIYEAMGRLSFGWLFLLRSVPVIPYRVQDMAFGLSRYSLRKYMLVAALASPLRLFWMQYSLVLFKDFLSLESGISLKNFSTPEAVSAFVTANRWGIMSMCFLTIVYLIIAAAVFIKFRKEK
jgi:uncharacterized membrane protein YdjX (TVP38/TMEM64 family)